MSIYTCFTQYMINSLKSNGKEFKNNYFVNFPNLLIKKDAMPDLGIASFLYRDSR